MGRPSKPAELIKIEGNAHRTKKELAVRQKGEGDLLSGCLIQESKEVRKNREAHKEFQRVVALFSAIGKDDDLYGAVINRYCLLRAREVELENDEARIRSMMTDDLSMDETLTLQKEVLNIERQLQSVEKSMFDIEKENVMTIASALRSVPKKPETKKSPLMEALASGN